MRTIVQIMATTLLFVAATGGGAGCKRDEPPASSSSSSRSLLPSNSDSDALIAATPSAPTLEPQTTFKVADRWITISYAKLVDLEQLTQSGSTISSLLSRLQLEPHLKGELQPFLSPFACLLPHALDMILKTAAAPRKLVADSYAPGSAQPAWVAIARSGRIVLIDDGDSNATVFVPGQNAETAYRMHYSVLRHMLLTLIPGNHASLRVSIYSYENNFGDCKLRLNVDPHVVEAADFPPPPGKSAIDIVGLKEFFEQGIELSGGHVDEKGRLVLIGKRGEAQTLDGEQAELSDLAVAYRAVFHCDDSGAFVSLDRNRDPTQVTVSFGGLLEDTRIGAVVLQADRRFKTITSGLDPTSFADIREIVRSAVPDFASVGERDLCTGTIDERGKWIGTRFWFYPESVEIEADLSYRTAVIRRACFTADAERSKSDFQSPQDFEQRKKSHLSPSIRENIRHLNEHYGEYARVFPELKELSVVARLMGICIWLKKASLTNLDLDGLLAVNLPGRLTPRQSRQLMAASMMLSSRLVSPQLPDTQRKACVHYLSNTLDRSIEEVFPTDESLTKFLSTLFLEEQNVTTSSMKSPRQFREEHAGQKVSDAIRTEAELRALAGYAAGELTCLPQGSLAALAASINAMQEELKSIERDIARLDALMSRSVSEHNLRVNEYNDLVMKQRRLVTQLNGAIDKYNSEVGETRIIIEIGGGISMESDRFTIRRVSDTEDIARIRTIGRMAGSTYLEYGGEHWTRTRPYNSGSTDGRITFSDRWRIELGHVRDSSGPLSMSAKSGERYWRSSIRLDAGWRDQLVAADGQVRERFFNAVDQTLSMAEWEHGELKAVIVGRFADADKIIFEPLPRCDLMRPEVPPLWWTYAGQRDTP